MPPVALAFTIALACAVVGLLAAVARLAASSRRLAAELATHRHRFAACMDLAPFCAYMKDADGRYVYQNRALLDITQRVLPHVTSFLGRTDAELFPESQATGYANEDRDVLASGAPIILTNTSIDADGAIRHWSTLKFPWSDERGRPCVAGLSIDLTETRSAEEIARTSADRCALALEAGRMGTMTLDLKAGIVETSPLFAMLHGRPETKTRLTLEESLADIHPEDRQGIEKAIRAALENQAAERATYRVVKPDGSVAWIEFVGQVTLDADGHPALVRGVGFDVTTRQEAFEEIVQRKAVLRRLIEVQESERQTLCHELHDGLIQYAIGAKMILQSIRDAEGPIDTATPIRAAIEALDRGIDEGRLLIRGVRTAVLDDLGLRAAIQDLVDQLAPLVVDLAIDPAADLDGLPTSLQTTIYRLLQEGLTNVRKHAVVARAAVDVRRGADDVVLGIHDIGRGFDVGEGRMKGFGIVGMVERARLAGGSCDIESRPGAGTRIVARLPVPSDDDKAMAVDPDGMAVVD